MIIPPAETQSFSGGIGSKVFLAASDLMKSRMQESIDGRRWRQAMDDSSASVNACSRNDLDSLFRSVTHSDEVNRT